MMRKIVSCILSFAFLSIFFTPKGCFADENMNFNFTDLGNVASFLSFEKNPRSFVETKYKKPITLLKGIGTVAGCIAGGVLGYFITPKEKKTQSHASLLSETDKLNGDINEKSSETKRSWGDILPKLLLAALFAVLGAGCVYSLTNWVSLSFLKGKIIDLECEKNAKTLAIKSLLRQIKDSSWKAFDSLLIRLHLSPDNFDGNAMFQNNGLDYTSEERANFDSSFDNLQQNLTQLINRHTEN